VLASVAGFGPQLTAVLVLASAGRGSPRHLTTAFESAPCSPPPQEDAAKTHAVLWIALRLLVCLACEVGNLLRCKGRGKKPSALMIRSIRQGRLDHGRWNNPCWAAELSSYSRRSKARKNEPRPRTDNRTGLRRRSRDTLSVSKWLDVPVLAVGRTRTQNWNRSSHGRRTLFRG